MDKGKIRDSNSGQWYSIKLQFNSEDLWTKALRYMLTNLKWGLAFVSMHCAWGTNLPISIWNLAIDILGLEVQCLLCV